MLLAQRTTVGWRWIKTDHLTYSRTRVYPAKEIRVRRWRKGWKEIVILSWREKIKDGVRISQISNSPQAVTIAKEIRWWGGRGHPFLCKSCNQRALRVLQKGPACQYKWEIPATIIWYLPRKKAYRRTSAPLTSIAHRSISASSTSLFYPKDLGQCKRRAALTRSQPGCCSDSSMGKQEEKALGKASDDSQWDPSTEGQRGKMLEEESSCYKWSLCTPDQLFSLQ